MRRALAFSGWAALVIYFAAAGVLLVVRYWLLPNASMYSGAIEQAVSRALGERVSLGAVSASWQGLSPQFDLTEVKIHGRDGRLALSLPVVEATLDWSSILYGSIRFHSLALEQPELEIRRDAGGRLFVAGLELKDDQSGPGISAWLLSQREIVIRNASVSWDDEKRAAPRLDLSGVTVVLRNSGDAHRFALRAQSPPKLASALDVRGELRGSDFEQLQNWTGRLYAALEYTDLAAWQRWLDYPFELASGQGGVRLWLGFSGRQLNETTADVALAAVRTRLAPELPLLELDFLQGRIGAKRTARGFEVAGRKLSLKSGGGVALAPADFDVRWDRGREGRPHRGEIQASALELGPLARLAEFLPFPPLARERLSDIQPRGTVSDLRFTWAGDIDAPAQYSARARFGNVGAGSRNGGPGFAGLSGRFDATEKGGTAFIGSEKLSLVLPGILPAGQASLDTLTAQVGWTAGKERLELKLNNVALANREIAGALFGSFRTQPGSPGIIDLTGSFPRVDGRSAYRYIPWLPPAVGDYLKNSVLSGQASEVRLRLKGDLAHFPFGDPARGVFQVAAKVNGVDFDYAADWPRLSGVSGELVFEGRHMRVLASRGSIAGVRIAGARAGIADLFGAEEVLHVEGQAEGPTAEFLGFLQTSPVRHMIDGRADGLSVSGNGRLQLTLDLPIRRLKQSKVAGSYQFAGNRLVVDPALPAVSQLNGRVDFTESGISARNLGGQFLGGAASVSLATRAEGELLLAAQGSATLAALRTLFDHPFLEGASGAAAWRGNVSVRGKAYELAVESSLQGVAIQAPSPLGKRAADTMALKLERTNDPASPLTKRVQLQRLPAGGDLWAVSIGSAVDAALLRAPEGERMVFERIAIGLNQRAPALERPGLAVAGSLPYLDLDQWRGMLGGGDAVAAPALLELRIGAMDLFGKRLHELGLRASGSGDGWAASVKATELAGNISWRPEARGRVVARLKHFKVPETAPGTAPDAKQWQELPALDVVAESFAIGERDLGRLELVAVNQARDWRIEKLVLSTPESTLGAQGYWQNWAARPSTSLNVKLEVREVGQFLDRIGYPKTMRGGTAQLEGKLSWVGSPQSIDYPTLTGEIGLKVGKGQFLKADPGAAKLLGLLSLQSLLTFDLRDLFSDGFAFDTLTGTAQIAKGVLTTKDFDMRGATARVGMTGDIDLARESQALRMRVVPSLGDSAATAATLLLKINPLTGLGAMIAQRILKDPLGQIFALEYAVTGTWEEPRVQRAGSEPAPAE